MISFTSPSDSWSSSGQQTKDASRFYIQDLSHISFILPLPIKKEKGLWINLSPPHSLTLSFLATLWLESWRLNKSILWKGQNHTFIHSFIYLTKNLLIESLLWPGTCWGLALTVMNREGGPVPTVREIPASWTDKSSENCRTAVSGLTGLITGCYWTQKRIWGQVSEEVTAIQRQDLDPLSSGKWHDKGRKGPEHHLGSKCSTQSSSIRWYNLRIPLLPS